MALTKIQAAGLTADLIDETKLADNSIDSEHYNDGSIDNAHLADDAVGTAEIADDAITNALMADDAVGVAQLSATGTASSSTFLRGDNSWVTPTDTNTTYSVGDGGLTTNDFTNADHTKLDGIAASANNYVHPNHSGDVTSSADGATTIADNAVTLAKMAAGTDGQIITYDASGDPIAVGPGTDGQVLTSTGAGSPPAFEDAAAGVGGASGLDVNDNVKVRFGTDNDTELYHDNTSFYIDPKNGERGIKVTPDGSVDFYQDNELVMSTQTDGVEIYPSHDKTSGAYLDVSGTGGTIVVKAINDTAGSNTKFELWTTKFSDGADVNAIQIDLWNTVNLFANYHSGWAHHFTHGSGAGFYRPSNNTWGITNYYSDNGGTKTYKAMVTDAGNFSSVSDYRLKENISYITEGITVVKQLKPCKFKFINGGTENLGFIAHEVQAVIPEAVIGNKDQMKSDGETPYYQTLTTTEIIPHLTAALQQAIEKIETLETKVAALEAG